MKKLVKTAIGLTLVAGVTEYLFRDCYIVLYALLLFDLGYSYCMFDWERDEPRRLAALNTALASSFEKGKRAGFEESERTLQDRIEHAVVARMAGNRLSLIHYD